MSKRRILQGIMHNLLRCALALGLSLCCFPVPLQAQRVTPSDVAGIAKALVARCANGQVLEKDTTTQAGVKCATPGSGGGGDAPGGSDGAVQYRVNSTTLGGFGLWASNILAIGSVDVSGLTATAIGGGSADTYYRYYVSANFQDGSHTSQGVQAQDFIEITDGNDTLDVAHYPRLTWDAVPHAISYSVYAAERDGTPSSTGLLATVMATTFDDTGIAPIGAESHDANNTGTLQIGATTLGNNGTFAIPNTADVESVGVIGNPLSDWDATIFAREGFNAQYVLNSINTGNAGPSEALLVYRQTTTRGTWAMQADSYNAGATGGPTGLVAQVGQYGATNNSSSANGVFSGIVIFGTGNLGGGYDYYADNSVSYTTGNINGPLYGYYAADLTGGTSNYGFYSDESAGSGHWAFYGAGTAAAHFGGEVEVIGLKTTGAATGKKVVCVDTATGQLYASSTGTDCSN